MMGEATQQTEDEGGVASNHREVHLEHIMKTSQLFLTTLITSDHTWLHLVTPGYTWLHLITPDHI